MMTISDADLRAMVRLLDYWVKRHPPLTIKDLNARRMAEKLILKHGKRK